jgi:hypothetical protein
MNIGVPRLKPGNALQTDTGLERLDSPLPHDDKYGGFTLIQSSTTSYCSCEYKVST